MRHRGKKYRTARSQVAARVIVPLKQAIDQLKKVAYAGFDESVDVVLRLGIDPAKGEQAVRGSVVLPAGNGKKVKVLVFAKGEHAQAAQQAGADYVGSEDLIEKIEGGWIDFNYAVATPDMMGKVGKLAKALGPRGLLPNQKLGTVTFDVAPIVRDLKSGRIFFKNDKQGAVHVSLGKVSFDAPKLQENIVAFLKALAASRPAKAKGKFLKSMTISSSMGPGITVSPDEVVAA